MNKQQEIKKVLSSRRVDSDMLNIMEALEYPSEKFQQAFEVALEMDNQNLIKLVYSNFNQGKIIIEFTLLGKSRQID